MSRSQPRKPKAQRSRSQSLVRQQPLAEQARQLLENIYQMVELKQIDAAVKLLATLQEVDPANPEALYLQGELDMQNGKAESALQNFMLAAYHRPNDAKLLGNLARLYAQLGHYRGSITTMYRVLELLPDEKQANVHAMQTLGALYYMTGRKERGSYWISQSARLRPCNHTKASKEPKIKLLVLNSAESTEWTLDRKRFQPAMSEGHNNLAGLLDGEHIEVCRLFVDHLEETPEVIRKLPRVDLIYNSITDADRCAEALLQADKLCEKLYVPVVNPPKAVLETTREDNYQRFSNNPDLILPRSVRVDDVRGSTKAQLEKTMAENGFELPVIVRLAGFQGGKYMHKVDDLDSHDFSELDAELERQTHSLYVIQYHAVDYIDERTSETPLYPKYRAFMVAGTLYPAHLFTADDFNVHKKNADPVMQANPWLIEKEVDYCKDPAAHLSQTQWQALEAGMQKLGLDYVGVDFAPATGPDDVGRLVIFEMNAAMRNWVAQLPEGDHVQQAWRVITEAAHHHFAAKAEVEPWEFLIPRGADGSLRIPRELPFTDKVQVEGHAAANHRWLAERLGEPNDFSDSPFFDTKHYIDEELLAHEAHQQGIAMQRRPFRMLEFTQGDREVVFHINAPRIPMDVHLMERNKLLVKELLRRHGLPTPQAEAFTDFQDAYRYFAQCERPQVVKPTDGFASRGVTVDVTTPEQFQEAWKKAKEVGHTIMLEDMIVGEELRVYFIGGQFIGATVRAPAFVIGDGRRTIDGLIEEKNYQRSKNPVTAKVPINSTPALDRSGWRRNEIPKAGEWVVLNDTHMATKGAEYIALGEALPGSVLDTCCEAAKLLPTTVCGVDLFVEDLSQPERYWITEVNASTPAIGGQFHFPRFGEPTAPANSLLTYAFEHLALAKYSGHANLEPALHCASIKSSGPHFITDLMQRLASERNLLTQRLDKHHDALLLGSPARLGWIQGVSTHTALESVQILQHPEWLNERLQTYDIPSEPPEHAFEVQVLIAKGAVLAAYSEQDGTKQDVSESLHQGVADVAARAMQAIYSPGHALLTLNLTSLEEHPETTDWSLGFVDLQPDLSIFYSDIDTPRDVISSLLKVWWPNLDQELESPVAQQLNIESSWEKADEFAAWLRQQLDLHALEGSFQPTETGTYTVEVQGQPNAVSSFIEHCRFTRFIGGVEVGESSVIDDTALANTLALRLHITGKVQGVGYRHWFTKQLTQHGIPGWVRNLTDGSVEAVIHGPQETLQQLLDKVPSGPAASSVTGLNAELWEGELPEGVKVLADAALQ